VTLVAWLVVLALAPGIILALIFRHLVYNHYKR
jgi:hypothetical protein